ncbi:urease accessory protein UreD [Nonomuraea sp. ZG12]|uniref:urease accessory protein UreD n=1 Tax=Nonomuraea sp. ZG12 TaxID=3452207 RepID=UPI003F8B1A0D
MSSKRNATLPGTIESRQIVGETMLAGRLARGERHAYTAHRNDLEVRGPDGELLFADPIRLVPGRSPVSGHRPSAGRPRR